MKVLGLDTSTATGGAALVHETLVGEYVLGVGAEHSEQLLPAVERIMADAGWHGNDLDAIAVATGPGSFTGLRIGVTTAKMLAYVWDKPLVGVNTLEAMAWQVTGFSGLVVPALNARRGLVYAAIYRVAAGAPHIPVVVHPPDNLLMNDLLQQVGAMQQPTCILGDVVKMFATQISADLGEYLIPLPEVCSVLRPASIASLGAVRYQQGEQANPFTLLPAYIRKPEAEVKWETAQRS